MYVWEGQHPDSIEAVFYFRPELVAKLGATAHDAAAMLGSLKAALICAVPFHTIGPDSKVAEISPRCSGARPLHAARNLDVWVPHRR